VLGVSVVPVHDLLRALPERDLRDPARDQLPDLGVVEHQRIGLVAQDRPFPLRDFLDDLGRRHVHDVRGRPGRAGQVLGDRIPGEVLVRGDVHVVADRLGVAEQSDESAGEVLVVGQRPHGRPVAVDHGLPAASHAVDDRPSAVKRDQGGVIGVRGAHDGHGEAYGPVRRPEGQLTGDLVLRVRRERVAQRGRFDDRDALDRLLVSRRRTDENVLTGPAAEQVDVAPGALLVEYVEVDHHVEFA
jgi:hypothetical protein